MWTSRDINLSQAVSSAILLITIVCLKGVSGLRCYTCTQADSNEQCNKPEHLIDCATQASPGMSLDTCQTQVAHHGAGVTITKKCVAGPCSLAGDQETALGMGCHEDGPRRTCEECCTSDGCNTSRASSILLAQVTLPIMLPMVALLTAKYLL